MVAWTWSELAVYGIKDSPKEEAKVLNYTMDIW